MKLEHIQQTARFFQLREEWNDLLRSTPSDCVFLTHEWLATWWKHLAGLRKLSIFTVRDGNDLVAVAPLARRAPQYSRMMPETIELLGSGMIGSDYLDIIVRPELENEVFAILASRLIEMGRMVQFAQLRRDACRANMLAAVLDQAGWRCSETTINVCPFIDLTGHTWESYLRTLGSSQRYNFQRRLRNLQKNFRFRLEYARTAAEVDRFLDILIALHRKRWNSRAADSEAFQSDAIIGFHREFTRLAAERGWLRLLTLWLNDEPAGGLYGLQYERKFYFYQSGFDPAYGKQSLGLVMMGLAIKGAIEDGAAEYDLLHGGEEYKFHWTHQTRDLSRTELYPPHARGLIYRRAIHFNRAARQMARRVLIRA